MALPQNILNAFENGRLKSENPIKYQVFQLLRKGDSREHVLVPSDGKPFDNECDAHIAVAGLIEHKKLKNVTFSILPIISV